MKEKIVMKSLLYIFLLITPLSTILAGDGPSSSNPQITPPPIGPIYPKPKAPTESDVKVVRALIKKKCGEKCGTRKPSPRARAESKKKNQKKQE